MKYCINSNNCPWGNAFKHNTCAYSDNLKDNDDCPMMWKNIEFKIDKLIDKGGEDLSALTMV